MKELSTALAVSGEAKNRISNSIINGIYSMSTIEFRAICALASQVPRKENDETIYSLSAKELAQLMNLNEKSSYAQLESLCREISGKTIVIEISKNKQTKAWIPRKWFDFILYDNGVIYYNFSLEIQPYLTLVRKAFVEIPSSLLMKFKSFYGIRLFLLTKQWYDYAQRQNQPSAKRKLSIDEIKNIFILEGKYKSFSDLERFVLRPAIKEVEKLTQLRLPYTIEKNKTKVSGIVFNITEVVDTVAVIDDATDEEEMIVRDLLQQCKCNARTINRLMRQYSAERIIRLAKYTLAKDGIKSPAAYLTEMLKRDSADAEPVTPAQKIKLPVVTPAKTTVELVDESYRLPKNQILEEIKAMNPEEQQQLLSDVIYFCQKNKKRNFTPFFEKGIEKCIGDPFIVNMLTSTIRAMRGCDGIDAKKS